MQLTVTQSQIRGLLQSLPAGHPERPALEALVREQSTLRVLHEVGLAAEANQATRDRFAKWPESTSVVTVLLDAVHFLMALFPVSAM